jgi:hypothetical protein
MGSGIGSMGLAGCQLLAQRADLKIGHDAFQILQRRVRCYILGILPAAYGSVLEIFRPSITCCNVIRP